MSASREKKQRQGAGPDQKAVKAQQEQAAHKRRTIIYAVTGGVIAVLVAALLVWRSGFFQARTAAASVGGETLSAAELSYYYYSARQTTAMYASYGLNTFDGTKPDDEQFYSEADSQTYRDYFLESALSTAQQQLALSKEAVNAGHSEAEVKDDLNAQIASVKADASSYSLSYSAYLKAMYGDYMTSGVYEKLTSRYLMARLVAEEKYDELYGGYAQSDLDAYYKEHADDLDTVEYSVLYFAIPTVGDTDEEGNARDDDEKNRLIMEAQAAARENAEAALEAVRGGSTFTSQIEKYELNTNVSRDHDRAVGTSSLNTTYREQLLDLGRDECGLVETESGYYVISFHDRYLDETPTRDVRHILVRAVTPTNDYGAPTEAPTDDAWAAAREKMEGIQDAWNSGEQTEDAFAALANEHSDDGNGTTGGLYERVSSGRFVTEFDEWMFDSARRPGDVELVQHVAGDSDSNKYYGYHLIYYVGENEPAWVGTSRAALAEDAQQEWADELAEGYPTAQLDGARYFGK